MADEAGPLEAVNGSQDSVSGLNRWNAPFSSADQPSAKQSDLFHSMLHSQPGKCTKDDPYGWAGDSLGRKRDAPPAKTHASPGKVESSPSGDCKQEKGKDAKCGAKIGGSAEIGGEAAKYTGANGSVTVGQAKAKAEGSASWTGVSGEVSAQVTAAKGEAKGRYGGAEGSASATALQAKAGVAAEASTKKVGVDACLKGEAVSGELKGSVHLPYTDRDFTASVGVGVGAAACVKAEVSDKEVGAKAEVGVGAKISGGIGIQKRD